MGETFASIEHYFREDRCEELVERQCARYLLPEHLRSLRGVFVDVNRRICKVTAAEALLLSDDGHLQSILSIDAGRTVIHFAEIGPPTLCVTRD